MSYTKQQWHDDTIDPPYGPISASRLGHIEDGISAAQTSFDNLGIYNVRDYGATGNGTTDDTAAINSAIVAAPAGSTIFFPLGTYQISSTRLVTKRLRLLGVGSSLSVLRATGALTGTLVNYALGVRTLNCIIDGISFDCSSVPTATCLALTNWSGGQVRNSRFVQGATGLGITNSSGVYFKNLSFSDQTTAGIDYQGDGGVDCYFEDIVISRDTAGTLQTGFNYSRTTFGTQYGGLWLDRVSVIGNGNTVNYGYSFTSSAGTPSHIYLFMQECIADNINGISAVNLNNVELVNISHCFLDGTNIPAITITGGLHFQVIGNYLIGGILFGAPDDVAVYNNIFSTGTAFQLAASPPTSLQIGGNRILGTFTDSQANLAAALTVINAFGPPVIYGPNGMIIDYLPADATQSKSVFLRFNNRARFGYDGTQVIMDDNGQDKDLLFKTSAVERFRVLKTTGGLRNSGGMEHGRAVPVYSTSITPDARGGTWQTITATDGVAFTINAPANPPDTSHTAVLAVEVLNSSGGALGVITWDAAFVFAGLAWTNPANTKNRYARFEWNGSKWICTLIASADY